MVKDIGVHGNLFGGIMMAWIDEANEREPPLPEDSDDEREPDWDWTEGWESSDEDDMSVLFDKDSNESEMSEFE